jgi:glycosyltransferase involved in cell wall biosynthesis
MAMADDSGNLSGTAAVSVADTYLLVLLWEPHHVGGVNVVVKNLAAAIRQTTELQPLIAVSNWSAGLPVDTVDGVRFRFAVLGRLTLIRLLSSLVRLPARLFAIHCFLRSHRVVVVNFHYFSLDACGVALLKLLQLYRGKLVISIHGSDVRPATATAERLIRNLVFAGTDAVVAVSQSLATRATHALGLRRAQIAVVYNGVDQDLFCPDAVTVPDGVGAFDGRSIVSIGRYDPLKDQMCLLEAFAHLAPLYPDLLLYMAGDDGPELVRLRREVSRRGIDTRVRLLSFLPPQQVAALLARCTVCVQPSLSEGLGLTLLEAGAVGAPLVVSDIAGHDELVEHGVTGLRFPVGDSAACARAIASLLDDLPSARRMALTQRQRNLSTFTWANCVAGYLSALGLSDRVRLTT